MSREHTFLFAGQSAQESGMGKELWKIPAARKILERLKPSLGADLESITTEMPDKELEKTFNAQRAIHAHHLGHYFAYKAAHPELALCGALGHSMGIAAALVAAESMTMEDSGVFIRARARAFDSVCRSFKEPMGLAAVSTDYLPDYAERINAFPGISLALHNTIGRGVIGGKIKDLEAFARAAQSRGWPLKLKILRVEGPYHTSFFSPAKPALAKVLEKIEIKAPKVPLFMGTSGRMETRPERIKALLAEQADSCEKYFDAVWASYDHGCRNFLEVAYKPQPVTWIADQLQDEEGRLMPGVTITPLTTADLCRV